MADPVVVLVFLASAGQPDPTGAALSLAARQALGRDAVVIVEPTPELPTPDQAEALAGRARANVVVEVDWRDALHAHATVRVHREPGAGWSERDIDFRTGDPPDERGRTLGFAMASLIATDGASEVPDAVPSSPPDHPDAAMLRPPFRVMIEGAGLATLGGGAGTTAAGGQLAGMLPVGPRFAVVATADARFGEIPAAQSSLSSFQVGGGAGFRVVTWKAWEADLRADALATFLAARRTGQTQSAWLPGARVAVEGVWFPWSPRVGVLAMAGGEAAFGSASVVVGDRSVATVPPFRAIGEVGLRARF